MLSTEDPVQPKTNKYELVRYPNTNSSLLLDSIQHHAKPCLLGHHLPITQLKSLKSFPIPLVSHDVGFYTARDGPMQCWDYFASGSKAWAPLRRSVIGLHVLLGSGLGACIFLDSLSVLPYDSSLLSHFPTNPQTGNIFIYLFLLNIFFKAIGKIACPQERKTRNQRDNKGTKLSLGSLFDFPVIHEL